MLMRRALLAALAVVLAWVGTALALRTVYAGKVLPGTHVAGMDLGGMSLAEAERELGSLTPDAVTLVHGERRLTIEAGEIGFRIDVSATAERALEAGRDSGPLSLFSDAWLPWSRRDVAAANDVDRDRLDAAVASIAGEVDRAPFTGALKIDPKTLGVDAEAPRPGLAVRRRKAARAALGALRNGEATVRLPVRERAAPALGAVQAVARRARSYLDSPLELSRFGGPARLGPRQLAPILAAEPVGDGADRPAVRLGVDAARLAQLVGELAAEREREPRDARIRAPASPAVVDEQLDLSWRPRTVEVRVEPGRAGRAVRQPATAEAIAEAVRSGSHAAELSTRRREPELSARAARRVSSLIGTFTTHFSCCEPRVTNIELIAQAVDGTVIAPGEQFSLNGVAGPRTAAKGYVPAPFISGGELVDAVGGGVSQFSTTVYNAAYFAGLELDSHQPHSWYISRYPPGREATLNYGSIELLWTNDTDAAVLVRSSTTGTSVTVSLYGDNGGRRVKAIAGPRQPVAGGDFAITVTRVVRYPGGRTARQPFTTTYQIPGASG